MASCLALGGCATAAEEPVDRPFVADEPSGMGSGGGGGSSGSSGGGAAVPGKGGSSGSTARGGSAGTMGGSAGESAGSGGISAASGASGTSGSGGSGGSPLPSGELLFADDFEASNAEDWIANTTGDWSIVSDGSNVYQQGTQSNNLRVAVAGDGAWTDQVVEAKVKALSFGGQSTSYLVGVFARFSDVDNHYYVALREDGQVAIRVRANGSSDTLGSPVDAGIVTGTWYTVRLEIVGSTLTAYLDGDPVVTVEDSSLTMGAIGIGSTNATAVFDDVVVTAP